jgi:acyl-CoA thioesterase FadM
MDTAPPVRFVTAALHVDYLAPTPIDTVLELRGRVRQIKGRKVSVAVTLSADGCLCARGDVVTVQMPEDWIDKLKAGSSTLKAKD